MAMRLWMVSLIAAHLLSRCAGAPARGGPPCWSRTPDVPCGGAPPAPGQGRPVPTPPAPRRSPGAATTQRSDDGADGESGEQPQGEDPDKGQPSGAADPGELGDQQQARDENDHQAEY